MSWALLAVSAVPQSGNAVLAASDDLLKEIADDDHLEYLTFFPETPGVYLWRGVVTATADEFTCMGQARLVHAADSELTHILNKNGASTL